MDSIQISGQSTLRGEVSVQGSKNVTLPILAATLMIRGVSVVHNCPKIVDIYHMIKILEHIGCKIHWEGSSVFVDARQLKETSLPSEYVKTMRSSVVLMGAMISRMGEITLHYPGGCVIGERPIDLHKGALESLSVTFLEEEEYIHAKALHLRGNVIKMPFPSVGATQNAILAAVTAEGTTRIKGGAVEPEVTELVRFLVSAGAKIRLDVNRDYLIEGVAGLYETEVSVSSDRIVAGTYLLAGVATRGEILLRNAPVTQLDAVLMQLKKMGAKVCCESGNIYLHAGHADRALKELETKVYPGFPTDLQSPLLAVLSTANGVSHVRETIFENRFKVTKELCKMGADIRIRGNLATVTGVKELYGQDVSAGELRGGAALVIAGLCARGNTVIRNRHFIDRGYEDICRDIRMLGGNIK